MNKELQEKKNSVGALLIQLEKYEEILQIIKKHKLLNYVLKNEKCANMYHLSKEECDLLRKCCYER